MIPLKNLARKGLTLMWHNPNDNFSGEMVRFHTHAIGNTRLITATNSLS